MKTFLITGASGYIGSHMAYQLRQSYPDCYIVGVDKVRKRKLDWLFNDFFQWDLCRTDGNVFNNYNYDCIFHFAGLASVPEGENNKYEYYHNNLTSSLNILNDAIKNEVKYFIFSSSCAVYGNPIYVPIDEEHEKKPISVYAKTKSMFEDMLLAAVDQKKIRGGILRYFNAAGRNAEAGLYEEHNPETHLIPLLVRGDTIDVYGKDYKTTDGTPLRDYIHVEDICAAHIKTYEYLQENESLVCNIGTGLAHSVIEVVEKVNFVLGKEVKMRFKSRRTGDAVALVSDVTKMKNVLQFQPKHDIVSIVKSMKD